MSKVERLPRQWTEKCVGIIGVEILYVVRDVILVQCACLIKETW